MALMVLIRKQKHFVVFIVVMFVSVYCLMHVSQESLTEQETPGWVPLESDILYGSRIIDFDVRNVLAKSLSREPSGCRLIEMKHQNKSEFDLRVIVMTYARPNSLLRLINSLNQANYGKAKVVLEIWIDRSKSQLVHAETLQLLKNATFSKGECNTIIHPYHVGIRGQWLSTWNPKPGSSEIAVILEDDLTVSPHFYSYLKLVHKKYSNRQDIYGYTLQGKSVRHSDGACCLKVPLENNVFLYPTLGTSGFSPNVEHWLKFKEWLHYVLVGGVYIPLLDNHIASVWYKRLAKINKADSMWEMEYLFYTYLHNQHTLYPNFADSRGFTFNWYEDGLHSTGEGITNVKDERNKLVLKWNMTLDDLPDNPVHVDNKGDVIDGDVIDGV